MSIGLTCDDCYGSLEVNSVLLATAAWCLPDLSELWAGPEDRGANTLIPHKAGRKKELRLADETSYSLPWLVTGQAGEDGTPIDEALWASALTDHWQFLYEEVIAPTVTGVVSSVPIVWYLPNGDTRSAEGQVRRPRGVTLLAGSTLRTTLELVVPLGDLSIA